MTELKNIPSSQSKSNYSLIRLDRMYESLRYNEYSMESGLGEIVDNSVEAQAARIKIDITTEKSQAYGKKRAKPKEQITQIVVADDGYGMAADALSKCLVLGESLRPKGQSQGIGRFGVGMTLGSISLARRVEVYSRNRSKSPFMYTYIDLYEILNGMIYIPKPIEKNPEQIYLDFLKESSGTVVILKNCDRLNDSQDGLANYFARTYRKYIGAGLDITLNDEKIYLHDPLYMDGPTLFDASGRSTGTIDPKAESLGETKIPMEIPGTDGETADIVIKMSLLPKEWRLERGAGGSNEAKKRKIDQNEGVSILRANREVLYGHVPFITGERGEASSMDIDRWWGCEISFPPELDSYFQVRYIKRGAEPVPALRNKIREIIQPVVKTARKKVKNDWTEETSEKNKKAGTFENAEKIMSDINRILPRNKKGQDLSEKQADEKLYEIAGLLQGEGNIEQKKEELIRKPFSIKLVSFPQTILFETDIILDSVIIRLNVHHPFYQKILLPLCSPFNEDESPSLCNEKSQLKDAILLLLTAYAKAEASFPGCEDMCEQLRTQWGSILSTAIKQFE